MLCDTCVGMVRDGKGRIRTATFYPTFEHHKSTTALQQSAEADCLICMALANILGLDTDLQEDQAISIRAILNKVSFARHEFSGITFRLDFELGKDRRRNFLLTETDPNRHMVSRTTSPIDVVEVTQKWMKQCKCADFWEEPGEKWYPRRLLDIEELRNGNSDLRRVRVRLVESSEVFGQRTTNDKSNCIVNGRGDCRYVTLSHCWGKQKAGSPGPLKMTFKTEKRFKKDGIALQELPKTFRDAILFASRLEKVRFIWIDSLCIRQPMFGPGLDPEEQLRDWFEQSRYMGKVYTKAFLNVSATASNDGHGGLFFDRRPDHLRVNEVDVQYPQDGFAPPFTKGTTESDTLTRCTVIDVSVWDDLVDQAPVNRRAWVFQERLLAPRVLHFCHNQMAWECTEFREAEGHPRTHLATRTNRDTVVREEQLKNLTVDAGRTFREARLMGAPDPDEHLENLYIYELWKRVVELYMRTELTQLDDRLIALAGIARRFHEDLLAAEARCNYIAGLWSKNLESQLLWHVNEVYGDRVFDNPAKRCATRAPSFSWASIESLHGITYGDVTDYGAAQGGGSDSTEDLLFKALDHSILLTDPENPFGMVKGGQLLLKPRNLRRIELRKLEESRTVPFGWCIKTDPAPKRPREYTNMYLDAPCSDTDIFEKDAELYCMPAAYGKRTDPKRDRYLYCLLLKYEGLVAFPKSNVKTNDGRYRGFRRIGMTKISRDRAEQARIALPEEEVNEVICLC